jgi:hypothetical protein
MLTSKRNHINEREITARATLLEIGQPPEIILSALMEATSLDPNELGVLVQRSGYTIRRWRALQEEIEIPATAACTIEDLRSIVAMLIEAGYSKRPITSFLRSRNAGLGRDRPLDGLRSDIGEFARVEHITQCFIEGFTPEQGRHVIERSRSALPVADVGEIDEPSPGLNPAGPTAPTGPGSEPRQMEEACL